MAGYLANRADSCGRRAFGTRIVGRRCPKSTSGPSRLATRPMGHPENRVDPCRQRTFGTRIVGQGEEEEEEEVLLLLLLNFDTAQSPVPIADNEYVF